MRNISITAIVVCISLMLSCITIRNEPCDPFTRQGARCHLSHEMELKLERLHENGMCDVSPRCCIMHQHWCCVFDDDIDCRFTHNRRY